MIWALVIGYLLSNLPHDDGKAKEAPTSKWFRCARLKLVHGVLNIRHQKNTFENLAADVVLVEAECLADRGEVIKKKKFKKKSVSVRL